MRIIFGDLTCRYLSAIWFLPNAGGQGEGEGAGKQQQHSFFYNHKKVAQDSHSSFVEPIVCQADSTDSLLCKTEKGKNARNCGGCVSTSEALGAVEEGREACSGSLEKCPLVQGFTADAS